MPALRVGTVAAIGLLLLVVPIQAACPDLTLNFFPKGTTNIPAAWAKAGQVSRGNSADDVIVDADIADDVAPVLNVVAVDPHTEACLSADCIPKDARRHRRLTSMQSSFAGKSAAAAAGSPAHRRKLAQAEAGAAPVPPTSDSPASAEPAAPTPSPVLVPEAAKVAGPAPAPAPGPAPAPAQCVKLLRPALADLQYKVGNGTFKPVVGNVITLKEIKDMPVGKNCITIKAVISKGSAVTNETGVRTFPAKDRTATSEVCFRKVAAGSAATEEAVALPTNGAAAPPTATAVTTPEMDAAAEAAAAAAEAAQAKYYCIQQYNVGSKVLKNITVAAADAGITECSQECSKLGPKECVAFGVSGTRCFLMKALNTSKSAPDEKMAALCMKDRADWLSLGSSTGVRVAPTTPDFYCVEGYDIKGDGAAAGDIENPVAVENTIVTTSAAACANTCKGTAGCQYFVQKAAACYLKMNLIGGKYGVTGAAKDVVVTCVNGVDSWLTFGSVLEINGVVPAPQEFLPAVIIPGVTDNSTVAAGSGTPGNYFCIKEYGLEGTVMKSVPVTAGDEALTTCAAQCDATAGCMGHATSTIGACQLLSRVQFNTSKADPKVYATCLKDAANWNQLGQPDAGGFYCLKKYDVAGEGIGAPLDFITVTSGAAGVEWCKNQCKQNPSCQFVVTSLGKCYIKQNIMAGAYGRTGASNSVDATCVNGEAAWQQMALQVSAAPAVTASKVGSLANRPKNIDNGGELVGASARSLLLSLLSSVLGGWLLLGMIAG